MNWTYIGACIRSCKHASTECCLATHFSSFRLPRVSNLSEGVMPPTVQYVSVIVWETEGCTCECSLGFYGPLVTFVNMPPA